MNPDMIAPEVGIPVAVILWAAWFVLALRGTKAGR